MEKHQLTVSGHTVTVVHVQGWFTKEAYSRITQPHAHRHCELFFHVRGNLSVCVEQSVYSITPGSVRVYASDELHYGTIEEAQALEWWQLILPAELFCVDEDWKQLGACFFGRPFGRRNVFCPDESQVLYRLLEEIVAPAPGELERQLRQLDLQKLLCLTNLCFRHLHQEQPQQHIPPLLSTLLEDMRARAHTIPDAGTLAKEHGLSVSYMGRLFRQYIGCSPYQYLLGIRLQKAKSLLRGSMPVDSVCVQCGFPDYNNFITLFRRKVGVSPARYGREQQGR